MHSELLAPPAAARGLEEQVDADVRPLAGGQLLGEAAVVRNGQGVEVAQQRGRRVAADLGAVAPADAGHLGQRALAAQRVAQRQDTDSASL